MVREIRIMVNSGREELGEHKENFCDSGHVLYIVVSSGYTGIFICKNVLGDINKVYAFYF